MPGARKTARFLLLAVLAALALLTQAQAQSAAPAENTMAALLKSGAAFAVMRHALAPGGGDPENFTLSDPSTQRNLSDEGRAQALAIGERFRRAGVAEARIMSSQWRRCMETAELMGLGPAAALPPLNSFFGAREKGPGQTQDLKAWLAEHAGGGERGERGEGRGAPLPLILVTHQVNITALTGVYPAPGEVVILRVRADGGVEVLGRF
ncbi:MAG: histidine phosphatase family protein [Rhodospirillales bacterium]